MKKIISLFLLVLMVASLFACGKEPVSTTPADSGDPVSTVSSQSETTASSSAAATETTVFPAVPVGTFPQAATVDFNLDGKSVEFYREFLSCYRYEYGSFVNGDGRGMFSSNPLDVASKMPEYNYTADSALYVYVNSDVAEEAKVYEAETGKSVKTSRLSAFAEKADEGYFNISYLANCLESGRYIIEVRATTSGTGDYAGQYYSELCYVILNVTASDNVNIRAFAPVVSVKNGNLSVSTYSELLYMLSSGHVMDGRLMFMSFKDLYGEIKDTIPTAHLVKENGLTVTVNGEQKNTCAVYSAETLEKISTGVDPANLREALGNGTFIVAMDCTSNGTGTYANDKVVYSHYLCVVIE